MKKTKRRKQLGVLKFTISIPPKKSSFVTFQKFVLVCKSVNWIALYAEYHFS